MLRRHHASLILIAVVACSGGEHDRGDGGGGGSLTGEASSSSGTPPSETTGKDIGSSAPDPSGSSTDGPEPLACHPPIGDGLLFDAEGRANPSHQAFTAAAVGPHEVLTVLADVELTTACEAALDGAGIDLGGEPIEYVEGDDKNIAVVQYDLSRPYEDSYLIGHMIGGDGFQKPAGVAVDSAGTVYIAGVFNGQPQLPLRLGEPGGVQLVGPPAAAQPTEYVHSFVVAYDATGEYLWHVQFGGGEGSGAWIEAISVDRDGGLAIAGAAHGEVLFGLGHECELGATWSPFVAVYAAGPTPPLGPSWVRCPKSDGQEARALAVDVDGKGSVAATGYFREALTWRDGQGEDIPAGMVESAGDQDLFVVRWDAAGVLQWHDRCGTAAVQSNVDLDAGRAVLIGDGGRVFVAGEIGDSGSCTQANSATYSRRSTGVVAARDPDGWAWEQVVQLDPEAPDTDSVLTALAQDSLGQLVTAGSARGPISLAGEIRSARGERDAIAAKFSCAGEPAWVRRFGLDAAASALDRVASFAAVSVDERDALHLVGAYGASFHPNLAEPQSCQAEEVESEALLIKLSP